MIRTQIQLTKDQVNRLRQLSLASGLSAAKIIRNALDNYIKNAFIRDDFLIKERALAAVGRFSSKEDDVSSNHDRYLSKAFEE